MLHPLQCAGSFCVLTHALPHLVVPPAHSTAHALIEQTSPCPQGLSQAPQCAGSFCVLTHALPHLVVPPVHSSAHWLIEQTSPAAQLLSHAPQCAGSFAVLTQRSPHNVVPAPHGSLPPPEVLLEVAAVPLAHDAGARSGIPSATARSAGRRANVRFFDIGALPFTPGDHKSRSHPAWLSHHVAPLRKRPERARRPHHAGVAGSGRTSDLPKGAIHLWTLASPCNIRKRLSDTHRSGPITSAARSDVSADCMWKWFLG